MKRRNLKYEKEKFEILFYPAKEENWSQNADIWTNSFSPITNQKIDWFYCPLLFCSL